MPKKKTEHKYYSHSKIKVIFDDFIKGNSKHRYNIRNGAMHIYPKIEEVGAKVKEQVTIKMFNSLSNKVNNLSDKVDNLSTAFDTLSNKVDVLSTDFRSFVKKQEEFNQEQREFNQHVFKFMERQQEFNRAIMQRLDNIVAKNNLLE